MSLAFMAGGGVVRLGEVLPVVGGDCLPFDVALPFGGKETPGEGGDNLLREDVGDPDVPTAGRVSGSRPEPAGPGAGLRPSLKAFAMSAAFHLEYLIFSSDYGRLLDKANIMCRRGRKHTDSDIGVLGKIFRTSRKLAAARNFLAVDL